VPHPAQERWRRVVGRLAAGPPPRGETFDICRRALAKLADPGARAAATRILLEGAMADAATDVDDAQCVMQILKAADRGDCTIAELLDSD
jgi:hypothetical protein